MGNRVSISFRNGEEESIALFDHWGGMDRVAHAQEYVVDLKRRNGDSQVMPLDRREPGTVMVDYIREITQDMERVESSLYVGTMKDPMYGDNSDNGHHVIDLE